MFLTFRFNLCLFLLDRNKCLIAVDLFCVLNRLGLGLCESRFKTTLIILDCLLFVDLLLRFLVNVLGCIVKDVLFTSYTF